jgi:NAD(P)-dependent dehydrogenase (short-subunit alcohol dehydrogenase family)
VQLDTNLKAAFFLNRAVGSRLAEQGCGGSIVNLASQGWWTGGLGGSVVYAASKGGIVSMTRGLARTLATDNVRVNTVAPGFVDTSMMRSGLSAGQLAESVSQVPIGRLADPVEIAAAILFLLGPGSSYITGATLNVSGGQLMY